MLCDRCGKNKASVIYEENINGEKKKVNLCSNCSKKLGIFNMDFMDNMFMSFFDEPVSVERERLKEIKCDKCGYTFSNYANTGLLGCAECYNTFKEKLEPVLQKLHGKSYHIENKKTYVNNSNKANNKLDELKDKLKECIEKEEYEKAAVIRDEIKKLNQRGDK